MRIAIIGAGPCGITAAKNLKDGGFSDITVFDRGQKPGGNWIFNSDSGHSSVFETTHIISSKKYSQYRDYPMPAEYPEYPSHRQLADYFGGYARQFGIEPLIRFATRVVNCKPEGDGWRVTTSPEKKGKPRAEHFDFLVVANGHHWSPRYPEYPGKWKGQWLHSHDFKRAEPFRDRRVLVIGGGNSACDVAVETSRISAVTDLSLRRGYWFIPKFIEGKPSDVFAADAQRHTGWVPVAIRQAFFERLVRKANGDLSAYGVPAPDHRILETHPTLNSELVYFIRHGKIGVKPDIERLDGRTVHFRDGTARDYDAIICCTGFWISHPFFEKDVIDYSSGKPPLYLKMLPLKPANLAFVGLFQPLGCVWPGAELQSKLLAALLAGKWSPPADLDLAIAAETAHPDQAQLDTPRHTITVDHHKFIARLDRELARAARAAA